MLRCRASASLVWRRCTLTCTVRFTSSVMPTGGAGGTGPVVEQTAQTTAVTRIQRTPLLLVEEITLPERVYTDVELLMMAWSEEQRGNIHKIRIVNRFLLSLLFSFVIYGVYSAAVGATAFVRGEANVPTNMRIGSVVFLDVSENGVGLGRLVIGLLNDRCPLYCEAFHRKCTASGGNGSSWRGLRMGSIIPYHICIFGSGRDITHDVPGFNPEYLPTEHVSDGGFRGALASIPYALNQESLNFNIHYTSGEYNPQIFGIVIGGFDIIERMNSIGNKHGNCPKRNYVVTDCGELCTLDKSHVTPIPWRVYESISTGYDAERFGAAADPSLLTSKPAPPPLAPTPARSIFSKAVPEKQWWRFGLI